MKRPLIYFAAAITLLTGMSACQDPQPTDPKTDEKAKISVAEADKTLTFAGTGDERIIDITSELEWDFTLGADSEWLDVVKNLNGTSITVSAGPWEGDNVRPGTIVISNGTNDVTISVSQGTIPYIALTWSKTTLGTVEGNDNLLNPFIYLSELPLDISGSPATPCMIFYLNAIIEKPAATNTDRYFDLPAGTYEMSPAGSAAPCLFNDGYNNYAAMSGSLLGDIDDAVSGAMTVSKSGDQTTATVVWHTEGGKVVKGKYTGQHIKIQNPNFKITGDFDIGTLTGGTGRAGTAGMLYAALRGWEFRIFGPGVTEDPDEKFNVKGNGYYIRLSTYNQSGSGYIFPDGEHAIMPDGTTTPSIIAGKASDTNQAAGAWFYVIENDEVIASSRMQSGSVTTTQITSLEDVVGSAATPATYKFEFDMYAEPAQAGAHITGSVEATMNWQDIAVAGGIYE